jgi:hypothetical protein
VKNPFTFDTAAAVIVQPTGGDERSPFADVLCPPFGMVRFAFHGHGRGYAKTLAPVRLHGVTYEAARCAFKTNPVDGAPLADWNNGVTLSRAGEYNGGTDKARILWTNIVERTAGALLERDDVTEAALRGEILRKLDFEGGQLADARAQVLALEAAVARRTAQLAALSAFCDAPLRHNDERCYLPAHGANDAHRFSKW